MSEPRSTRSRAVLAVLSLAFLPGCLHYAIFQPDMPLANVTRPTVTQQRYGPQTITLVKDSISRYRFQDSLITATFFATSYSIGFEIENRTPFPIQINWTEAAFANVDGKSQPVMHDGVKYAECASVKAPSVIVGNGRTTDAATPCNYVTLGPYGWHDDSFLGLPGFVPMAEATALADSVSKQLKGKTVSLLLPIKTQDYVNDYTFVFEVHGVTVPKKTP